MSRLRVVLPYEWGAATDARAIIASAPDDVAEHLAWCYARELNKGAVRTLNDMSEAEIAALEEQYKCKVKRPSANATTASPSSPPADALFVAESIAPSASPVASAVST